MSIASIGFAVFLPENLALSVAIPEYHAKVVPRYEDVQCVVLL